MHPISRNISERIYAHLQDLKRAPVVAISLTGVARLGGDEFAILLPETDLESSRQMIPRLQQVLMEEMNRSRCPITFSIGALALTASPRSIDEIIGLADQLMYEAKRGGKNAIRYSVYEG